LSATTAKKHADRGEKYHAAVSIAAVGIAGDGHPDADSAAGEQREWRERLEEYAEPPMRADRWRHFGVGHDKVLTETTLANDGLLFFGKEDGAIKVGIFW
jgi:hypothetical protein